MASIYGLGYLVTTATDLDAWERFAVGIHGMVPVERTNDRLLLRIDERTWRLDVRKGDYDQPDVIGWEVRGRADLDEFAEILDAEGFPTTRATPEEAAARKVTDFISFKDPTGYTIELFYGQKKASSPFASPTGARFVTGELGLGHIMMFVENSEEYRRLYMKLFGFGLSDFVDIGPDPGTFLHCNPRHHSVAFASMPGSAPRFGHLMMQVETVDTVGRAYDKVLDSDLKIGSTLGRHSNDEMLSYYVKTPGNKWEIEYGQGGLLIDETWVPARWDDAHFWGHRRESGSNLPG